MSEFSDYKKLVKVGGPKAVAEMLNTIEPELRKTWITLLKMEDPDLAKLIVELMFCFDDLAKISDKDMQILIREVPYEDLLIALKLTEDNLRIKVLANLSESQRKNFEEDYKNLPKVRKSQVHEIQKRIIEKAKKLEEQGRINLKSESEDKYI